MSKLLFFILMPIIFEGIMLIINECSCGWEYGNLKKQFGLFSILLIIDYIIEAIYLCSVKNILGVWIFSEEFDKMQTYDTYPMFVFCSILYIILCILFTAISLDDLSVDHLPVVHTMFLVLFFIAFSSINTNQLHTELDKAHFQEMEYVVEENTVYLKALGDGHTTTGSMNGSLMLGTGYIQGNITDNYNLYYAYTGSNGETVIDSLVYNNNTVDIYEEGPDCIPRIVFTKYSKEYETDYNHHSDEYYHYDIYIPSISNEIKVDME